MSQQKLQLGMAGALRPVTIETPDGEPRPWDGSDRLAVVGKPIPRLDGAAKVSGAARYTYDVALPGLCHAAVLRCPYPAAIVKSIELGDASSAPGVRAAIAVAKPGDRLIFAGQDVAAVAADRPERARDGLRRIHVVYEPQPHVVETLAAMAENAPPVHTQVVAERKTEGDEPGAGAGNQARGNVRPNAPMKKGDVQKALAAAKHRHEATYTTQVQLHSALETHGVVVRWDSDSHMTVWASTQSIFSVRDEMAEAFSLKPADVDVITDYLGGGFGAKFGAGAPGSRLGFIAGELARLAKAPVKLMCTRAEEQTCTGNRPDSHQVVRLGASAAGKLTAIHVRAHGSAGIATGAGVGRNAFAIYTRCPNLLVEASDVFTNAGPGTAMRAPGHPQGAFALELALDELAARMGKDPLELRVQHDEHPVRIHQLELGAERFGWKQKRERARVLRERGARIRRGVGVAASVWGDYGRAKAAVATVSVLRDGTIEVRNGVQDIGTGIPVVLAQVAAEVFGRPLESVRVRWGRSEFGPSVGSGGSQTTASVTPAVRNAAETAKTELLAVAARALGAAGPATVRWNPDGSASAGDKTVAFAELCKHIEGEAVTATGTRPATYGAHPMKFMTQAVYQIAGAQFAEVAVDTWTGKITVERVLAVHDCGRIMNELTLRSQINGGVILGASYALTEERVIDRESGLVLNADFERYKIAGSLDCPEIDVVLTEVHTGANSTGAVGIGEPACIPTAAAIANAVYDALGVPIRSLPITPDKVLAALSSPKEGAR